MNAWRGYYVERADPDIEGYEEGSFSGTKCINRYKWANDHACGTVLDIPTGMGWGASLLTNAENIIGIDISKEAIEKASSLYSNLLLITGDMTQIPIRDNVFDTIMCNEGYEHIIRKDQFSLMSELRRVIKPNGTLLMTIPEKEHSNDNPFHLYEPTFEEVKDTLANNFRIISMFRNNVLELILIPIW